METSGPRTWLSKTMLIIMLLLLIVIIITSTRTMPNTVMMFYSSPENSIEIDGSFNNGTYTNGLSAPKNVNNIPPEYNACITSGLNVLYTYSIPEEFIKVLYTSVVHQSRPESSCSELRYLAPPGAVTALASFPGSGNTWMRHVLQQVTG